MVKPSGQTARDRKSRILDAADAVFVRRGIDGARMQEIADRAGVNKALIHYHFQSKQALAHAVWLRIASSFAPGIMQMLASDIPLDEKIELYVDAYHATLTRHPYLLNYVISEAARRADFVADFFTPELRRAARHMLAKLGEQLDERARTYRAPRISAEQFFVTLAGSCLFPFAARPMLGGILGLRDHGFRALMVKRRTELPAFLKRALQ
jgi:AcrR family transcriptional regulator